MMLIDVNIWIQAHREDSVDHTKYYSWVQKLLEGNQTFSVTDTIFSSFLRIVTHSGIFEKPSTITQAASFIDYVKSDDKCIIIQPDHNHWELFVSLCKKTKASGNMIPDVYLAALAIESGCELISADKVFASFPGLKYRHPLK